MQTVADMRGLGFKYIGKYADVLCGRTLMEVNLKDDFLLKSKITVLQIKTFSLILELDMSFQQ